VALPHQQQFQHLSLFFHPKSLGNSYIFLHNFLTQYSGDLNTGLAWYSKGHFRWNQASDNRTFEYVSDIVCPVFVWLLG
jgi:hypothetical protein